MQGEIPMPAQWIEDEITVGGARFFYRRSNTPGQPAMVLAHGFSDHGGCWMPVARALENEYDIILPDMRGHGRSERLVPGAAVDNAADLAAFIQALGVQDAIIGGHSMGAAAAAEMDGRFPGLARALVLEDPPWRESTPAPQPPGAPNPHFEWLRGASEASIEELIERARSENPHWTEAELLPWAESKQQMDLELLQAMRGFAPWREVVAAIQAPTLLITADPGRGGIVTPEVAVEAVELNERITAVRIDDAGHSIRRDNFSLYMETIHTFLSRFD